MTDDYIELLLMWTSNADVEAARRWLEQRGMTVAAMKSGVLVSGTKPQIEKAFSISLANITLPARVSVPAELRDSVASITIPKPPSYHP